HPGPLYPTFLRHPVTVKHSHPQSWVGRNPPTRPLLGVTLLPNLSERIHSARIAVVGLSSHSHLNDVPSLHTHSVGNVEPDGRSLFVRPTAAVHPRSGDAAVLYLGRIHPGSHQNFVGPAAADLGLSGYSDDFRHSKRTSLDVIWMQPGAASRTCERQRESYTDRAWPQHPRPIRSRYITPRHSGPLLSLVGPVPAAPLGVSAERLRD